MSELWRLRGEFTWRASPNQKDLGERYLRAALNIAISQEACQLRLRAALSLARLLGEDGRREEACGLLIAARDDLPLTCNSNERNEAVQLIAELA